MSYGIALLDLLASAGITYNNSHSSWHINNLCADSRKIQPGDLFVAIPCQQVKQNIEEALQKGAVAVIATADMSNYFADRITFIEHLNPRLALSLLAKAFFKTQPAILAAVTGTNGKSSVVSLVRQLWELLDYQSAAFGTVGIETNAPLSKMPELPALTTYDSLSFFQLLNYLAEAKVDHVAFEASSHGLEQFRIHGSQLSVAGFTNLTQDHLDYHLTMEDYFQAKARLFTEVLPKSKTAVLNADSPYAERLQSMISAREIKVITYGIEQSADLAASKIKPQGASVTFNLNYKEQRHPNIELNLCGTFQVENTLCAIAMVLASGTPLPDIIPLIPKLKAVAGRMELAGETNCGAQIYVDYAHTPDALERALKSLRIHTKNSVWVVFGCGGDRDSSKRPLMGKIAAELADRVIVTDDNPRFESAANIRQQILEQCGAKALEIADRREAIAYAIAHLEKGDTLLIAGKGHETGQTVGRTVHPFCDKQEAQDALTRLAICKYS